MKQRIRHWLGLDRIEQRQHTLLLAQARTLAALHRERCSLDTLAHAEYSIYSQWGEDGILDWLIEQLPNIPKSFVELGCGDYDECNTRLLMELRNWSGVVVDANPASIAHIKRQDYYWRYNLTAYCRTVTRDTFSDPYNEMGLLSLDLDGMDYWVWRASSWRSWLVICEYNDLLGDRAVTVPYQVNFNRTVAHHSNLYFGASLAAMRKLATVKGYTFLGTNSNGCNAFFVRSDYAASIRLKTITAHPAKFREVRDEQGRLTYATRAMQKALIANLTLEEV